MFKAGRKAVGWLVLTIITTQYVKTVVERIFVVNYFICLVYFVCSIPIDEFCNCISNKLLKNYSEESYDQIYQMIVCGSANSMLILGKPPGICLISGGSKTLPGWFGALMQ